MKKNLIWVIADDRAGNNNQSLGVAEALGGEIIIKKISYNKFIKCPNFIRSSSLLGVNKNEDLLDNEYPEFAIAAGRRAAPVLRWIKKKSKNTTKIIQIMFPGYWGMKNYDLIVLPNHDGCHSNKKNILRVIGAAHRITENRLNIEREKWKNFFEELPQPRIALIVGGATKNKPFTISMAKELADRANFLRDKMGKGSFLVTTSRRTGEQQAKVLNDNLKEPKFFYGWGNTEIENPYFGYLAIADYIIVTGDSVSMCSEACATNSPVYIYAPEGSVGKKHTLLHRHLYQGQYAQPLTDKVIKYEHHRLNMSEFIANYIKKELK
ncbi:MAG: mitochondrial fission ELM1 family protein [Alphaproteobacteria bacterium]|nr:mitochondrial fission ELM1 family protein [Alphaproteobacteria bacterium]